MRNERAKNPKRKEVVKKADKKGEGGKEGEGRRWRKQKREVKVTRRDEGRW